MIAFAVVVSALLQAGLIAVLIWRDIDHAKREDRLINLLASRTPHDYSVIARADSRPAKVDKPAEPRVPRLPVGL